jgi:UDP-glucose:(heptosyl)LPS alpha-1,3-glucosyltransferase
MRVSLVVRTLSVQGGTERVALGLASHLVASGDTVTAWVLDACDPVEGVEVRQLPRLRGRLPRMLSLGRGVARARTAPGDVVCSLVRAPGADVWRAGGGCHARYLDVAMRRMHPVERIELALDRSAARSAGRIVVNSELAGRDLVAHYGVDPDQLRLVRNGVHLQRFRPVARRARLVSGPAVVLVGHGWQRKGLRVALEVLVHLPQVHLFVVGRERWPGRFLRHAGRLGVRDRLHLMGTVDALEDLLPSFDALLLPTRYDPSANVCLEALACGVPVVTTACNGASEVLPHPAWGASAPDSAVELAETLDQVLHDRTAREAARAAAERWPLSAATEQLRALLVESCR